MRKKNTHTHVYIWFTLLIFSFAFEFSWENRTCLFKPEEFPVLLINTKENIFTFSFPCMIKLVTMKCCTSAVTNYHENRNIEIMRSNSYNKPHNILCGQQREANHCIIILWSKGIKRVVVSRNSPEQNVHFVLQNRLIRIISIYIL